jgi:quercetin dioxygenase-like cupin family protein
MPKVYHYFNVGQLPQSTNSIDGQNPLLLSINKTEYATKENNPCHSHKYLEFFYILDGEGEFITGETRLPLKKHDILAVNAEVIHVQRSTSPDRPLVFYSLLFDNIRIHALNENCISKEDFLYQPFHNENNHFFACISRLLAEISAKKSGYT